jgi:putative two-component system response regulator
MFAAEARLVRHHHENWNGTGYPDQLTREAIPLGSRIINVADSIDAMLMKRTYKGPYPVDKMLSELKRCRGQQFDPAIADTAANWCRKNPDNLILPQ